MDINDIYSKELKNFYKKFKIRKEIYSMLSKSKKYKDINFDIDFAIDWDDILLETNKNKNKNKKLSLIEIANLMNNIMIESLFNSDKIDNDLTQEDCEVSKCLQEDLQNGNNKGFQERSYNWTEKQKRKYYFWYIIIILLLNIFILPYLQEKGSEVMTRIESWIRKNPDKKGEVIEVIEDNTRCTVLEDIPYWIKIKWEENGVEKTGWIAKRNIYYIKEDE